MKKLVNFLAIIVALFSFATPVFSPSIASSKELEDKANQQYIEIAENWRGSIRDVTPGLQSQEISAKVWYVTKKLKIAKSKAGQNGIEILENEKINNPIFLVPVLSEEKGDWQKISFFSPVQFNPATRTIIIDGDADYSFSGMAIALAREYYRVYSVDNNIYKADQYWIMERDAQAFQNKYMFFLGGKKYVDLVYGEVDKLIKKIAENKVPDFSLLEPADYDERLSDIFGEPKSHKEAMYLQRVVLVHTLCIFIENTAKRGKAGEEKTEFIKNLDFYKEGKNQKASLEFNGYEILKKGIQSKPALPDLYNFGRYLDK